MKTERHGYKFTNKMNTTGGIAATVIGVSAIILFVTGIIISYQHKGNAGLIVGAIGSAVFIINTIGLVIGLQSFKERERFYLFSWIGTIMNGVLWAAMCLIIAAGIMSA